MQKEETLDRKQEAQEKREETLHKEAAIQDREERIEELYQEQVAELERLSGIDYGRSQTTDSFQSGKRDEA